MLSTAISYRSVVYNLQYLQDLQKNLKAMSIGELKEMIDMVNAFELQKQQEKERLEQELEKQRLKKKEEEMKRQKIFQEYLLARVGKTSFFHDFFTQRL